MPQSVALVDYGSGNLSSLQMALSAIGASSLIARTPEDLLSVSCAILPGVGHFGPASTSLAASGMGSELIRLATNGIPILGICLGFQLLTEASEEAPGAKGLGILPAVTQRITPINTKIYKVPHLGWNNLEPSAHTSHLLAGIPLDMQTFYFANSYGVSPNIPSSTAQSMYVHESPWIALLQQGNVFGVQFHPEKSRSQGLRLLHNFMASC